MANIIAKNQTFIFGIAIGLFISIILMVLIPSKLATNGKQLSNDATLLWSLEMMVESGGLYAQSANAVANYRAELEELTPTKEVSELIDRCRSLESTIRKQLMEKVNE